MKLSNLNDDNNSVNNLNNNIDSNSNNLNNNVDSNSNNIDTNVVKNKYKSFSYKEKLKIRESVNILSRDEKIEVLKLIVKNEEKYNENNNGVLFDLCKLTPKTLEELNNFLVFTSQNKKELTETETLINNIKKDFEPQ